MPARISAPEGSAKHHVQPGRRVQKKRLPLIQSGMSITPETAPVADLASRHALGLGSSHDRVGCKVQSEDRKREHADGRPEKRKPGDSDPLDQSKRRRLDCRGLLAEIATYPVGQEIMAEYDVKSQNRATLRVVLKQIKACQKEVDRLKAETAEIEAQNRNLQA